MWALQSGPSGPKRALWRVRAASTRARMTEELSPVHGGRGVRQSQGRDLPIEIHPVQKRAGELPQILLDLPSEQRHRPPGWPVPAAFAGVHGAHQHEAAGEDLAGGGPAICTRPSSKGWRRDSSTSL